MTLLELKDHPTIGATAILCELTLSDQTVQRWSNRQCTWNAASFTPRIIEDGAPEWRFSADGIAEGPGSLQLLLANADGLVSELRRQGKLAGAYLKLLIGVFEDGVVADAHAVFTGIVDNVLEADAELARITAQSRLNSIRASFPPLRIQRRCSWAFPANLAEREAALSSGEEGRYASLFRCGYSAGLAGGFGNLNGVEPFTSCDFTRTACEERGMFNQDAANHMTRRFSGIQYLPPVIQVRGHGESSGRLSELVSLDTRYNDVVPAVYGTGWLRAPVVFSRNDGNLTRIEALLGLGEIEDATKVVVNGYEIPRAEDGRDMSGSGWYQVVTKGGRTGGFNLNFTDGAGNPQGDPYGSMAMLSVVVPNEISNGKSAPQVDVLMKGIRLPVLDAEGHLVAETWSANPAWILCDILRRSGWKLAELDLPSFLATAAYCDEVISLTDPHGGTRSGKRFEANLVLRRRYSLAEILRGMRVANLLRVGLSAEGKLYLKPETTLALQQPSKPTGSNSDVALLGGWPAYEFDDGTHAKHGILLHADGMPLFEVLSRPTQDSVNRVNAEIQDALNEFRQDSFTLADTDDIALRRQELQQTLPAMGLPHLPQAIRAGQTWLNKAIAGNIYIDFVTNLRAIHLRPGDLIAVTYAKHGFDRSIFRVTEVRIRPDLQSIRLSAQLHQDHWYSDDPQVRYDRARLYAWSNRAPRAVVPGTPEESLGFDEQGQERALVRIPFARPSRPDNALSVPIVSFSYLASATGGSLASGNYFYGLTYLDSAAKESGLSSLIPVYLTTAGTSHQVTLQGLSFPSLAQTVNVYRGSSPYDLRQVASGLPVATELTDSGWPASSTIAPDANYSKLRAYFRRQLLGDQQPDSFSAATLGQSSLALTPNEWNGKLLVIREGKGKGQERRIVSHTASLFTLESPWQTLPDTTSRFAIVQGEWSAAGETEGEEITVALPLFSTETFEISLRSVASDGSEVNAAESPRLLWQIGVGSNNSGGLDSDVPPEPAFGFRLLEGGTLSVGGFSFSSFDNLNTAYAARLGLWFWDELTAPTAVSFAASVALGATEITLAGLAQPLVEGDRIQAGQEIMAIVARVGLTDSYTVQRAVHLSPEEAHAASDAVFLLERREEAINLLPGILKSTAGARFRYNTRLPNVRLAAADMAIYNRLGPSLLREEVFTQLVDDGMRTLSGGQIALSTAGYLSIEASAPGRYVTNRELVVGDVYAVVAEPPAGAAVQVLVRVDGVEYCTLSIPSGSFTSSPFSGFNRAPIAEGASITFDIVSVPPASVGSPGKDLTVFLQV
ncbi:MAG: phage tail protein [Bryobacter sp.]|nr:phage tail protein [Bryobacter sp.]